jgi:hypothetical protein
VQRVAAELSIEVSVRLQKRRLYALPGEQQGEYCPRRPTANDDAARILDVENFLFLDLFYHPSNYPPLTASAMPSTSGFFDTRRFE